MRQYTPPLEHIRLDAEMSAHFRGHSLSWGEPTQFSNGRRIQSAICTACGMTVQVDTMPPPNGIDIGGTAVALSCTR